MAAGVGEWVVLDVEKREKRFNGNGYIKPDN
jgi:hypothetical protein